MSTITTSSFVQHLVSERNTAIESALYAIEQLEGTLSKARAALEGAAAEQPIFRDDLSLYGNSVTGAVTACAQARVLIDQAALAARLEA